MRVDEVQESDHDKRQQISIRFAKPHVRAAKMTMATLAPKREYTDNSNL